MPPTPQFLDDPLFVMSVVAVLGTAVCGILYARRGRNPDRSSRPPLGPDDRPPALAGATSKMPGLSRVPHVAEPTVPDVTFADVAGLDEVVEELREIKEYLLDPGRFRAVGATLPRGLLLVGPPGTGKTLLTKALAGEAGIPFQVVSSASLVEVYVGVGAARVRSIFAQARKTAPSIVLLDELDAIGRSRSAHAGGGQEERESTLNQLLTEMDGFEAATGVLVAGATNRPDVLDAALLRPGRFDRRLVVTPPDLHGRRAILEVHARCKPLDPGADLDAIARRTAGFTGADLANVMNEAALLTGRRYRKRVGAEELEEAIDRLMTGPRRPTRAMSTRDKQVIAYHEGGHVLVGWSLAQGQDVHRVSVVARGRSHGYTLSVPTEDRLLVSRSELLAQLAVLMGGRVAEELAFADPTTGAEDDLARATALAERMVSGYGMSERVGLMSFASTGDAPAELGRAPVATEATAEVRRLLQEAYERAWATLSEHRAELDRLADRLVTVESLDKEEIEHLLAAVPRQSATPLRPAPGTAPARRQRRSAA